MRNANCFVVLFLNNLKTLVCVLESHIWHIINTYAFFFSMNFLVYKGTYFILTHACHLEFQWRVHPKRSNIVIHTGCRRRERNFGLHKGHKEADVNEVSVHSTPRPMSTGQRNRGIEKHIGCNLKLKVIFAFLFVSLCPKLSLSLMSSLQFS